MHAILKMILASLFFCGAIGGAAEIATGEGKDRAPGVDAKFSIQQYYAPRTPENKGRPEWPKKLNFESVKIQSRDEFVEILQGSWMPAFHCNGRPATAKELEANGTWDGINNKGVAYSFKDLTATQRLISPATSLRRLETKTRSGPIDVDALGDNRFKITFHGQIDSIPAVYKLRRVKETGERIIEAEDDNEAFDGQCANGDHIKAIFIPVPTS